MLLESFNSNNSSSKSNKSQFNTPTAKQNVNNKIQKQTQTQIDPSLTTAMSINNIADSPNNSHIYIILEHIGGGADSDCFSAQTGLADSLQGGIQFNSSTSTTTNKHLNSPNPNSQSPNHYN